MVKKTYIYTLSEPSNGEIRYVGKTDHPDDRLKTHSRRENTYKSKWIQSLLKKDQKPILEILDIVPSDEWKYWEQFWIAVLTGWGCRLVNGDRGGLGHQRMTPELNKKISLTLLGRPNLVASKPIHAYTLDGEFVKSYRSVAAAAKEVAGRAHLHPNVIRSIRNQTAAYGFLWSYSKVERISTRYIGGRIQVSQATRQKISQAHKGRWVGRIVSESTRLKQRLARLGKPPANKGRQMTVEGRAYYRSIAKTSRPVLQLTLDGQLIKRWDSIRHAANGTGATRAGIRKCALGRTTHAAGFVWKYEP